MKILIEKKVVCYTVSENINLGKNIVEHIAHIRCSIQYAHQIK